MSNVIELTPQPVSIVDGLRNLAQSIEDGDDNPDTIVWIMKSGDNLQCGLLGDCSDEIETSHFICAKAMRGFEGLYPDAD